MDVSPSPVPWREITAFVRQLSHDLRNDLNALSLEAALLKEFATDAEAITSANRIQSQLREVAQRLKDLSGRFVLPSPNVIPITLADLATHLQHVIPAKQIAWLEMTGAGSVSTDPALFSRAFQELAASATERAAAAGVIPEAHLGASDEAVLTLREPGAQMYDWPEVPFTDIRGNHYGIELPVAGSIFRGLGARIERKQQNGDLLTLIILPLV